MIIIDSDRPFSLSMGNRNSVETEVTKLVCAELMTMGMRNSISRVHLCHEDRSHLRLDVLAASRGMAPRQMTAQGIILRVLRGIDNM